MYLKYIEITHTTYVIFLNNTKKTNYQNLEVKILRLL